VIYIGSFVTEQAGFHVTVEHRAIYAFRHDCLSAIGSQHKASEPLPTSISAFIMHPLGPQLLWEARLQILRATRAWRDDCVANNVIVWGRVSSWKASARHMKFSGGGSMKRPDGRQGEVGNLTAKYIIYVVDK